MTPMKLVQFSRPPTAFDHLRPKFFHPPRPWKANFKWTPLPSPNDDQLKENIIQGGLLHVIRSFLQVSFCFQYQLINLVWLSSDFFSFSWTLTICVFMALYSCVWSCSKISRNVLFIIIHILVLILQSTRFICTTWKRKQSMEQQPRCACERTKLKQKQTPSHVTFKLTTRSIVRFSPVSLKDGFTVWRQSQKKDFLSIIY